MYKTKPLPLDVWTKLKNRLKAEFVRDAQKLTTMLTARMANVDNAETLLARAEIVRGGLPEMYLRFELLTFLIMQIKTQVGSAEREQGISDMQAQIEGLEMLLDGTLVPACHQPARFEDELDLKAAIAQFALLLNAGQGDRILEERARLRAIERPVRVLGAEDSLVYEARCRAVQISIDNLYARLATLRNSTTLSLIVPPDVVDLLSEFDVSSVQLLEQDSVEPVAVEPVPDAPELLLV